MTALFTEVSKGSFILIVPCLEKGRGGGHLSRSLALTASLREKGREAFLWVPEPDKEETFKNIGNLAGGFNPLWTMSSLPPGSQGRPSFIVLDKFRTSKAEFEAWSALAPLVGIDEGGPCRDSFDFLLDLLPSLPGVRKPNLCAPGLLPLPKNRRDAFYRVSPSGQDMKILVSFGAGDPAGLSFPAARTLARGFPARITLVAPAGGPGASARTAAKEKAALPGIRVLGVMPELKERFAEYDLLITHFGLGAFEALYARVPVLLVSPTAYHERLGKNAGFLSAGKGASACSRLGRLLSRPGFYRTLCLASEKTARRYGLDAEQTCGSGDYLADCFPAPGRPQGSHALGRFPERTYWRPKGQELIVMKRLTPPPIEYGTDYFFGLYKKQYGKTYLEDFPNLAASGRRRLTHIRALLKTSGAPSLLDIGCAYGPFLTAARDEGFIPLGLEPAGDAARYLREKLDIPCIHGFFPDSLPSGIPSFDAVTLWYVIEHFENPDKVLSEIYGILKPGGVLAFSTPSFSGISGRKSFSSFLEKSPQDHWTIWSPLTCASYLKKYGFAVKEILVTGHHPERFPLAGPFLTEKNPLYRIFSALSGFFRLGDTFEAYAVKESTTSP
jgi:SAM-dependent methyltransferase